MNPQMGVTKQQVEMQLTEFKRQLVIKQRLFEIQRQRIRVCDDARTAYINRCVGSDRWDDSARSQWYDLESVQSELMSENLKDEISALEKAIMEMTEILNRMSSSVILPRLQPGPNFNPSKN